MKEVNTVSPDFQPFSRLEIEERVMSKISRTYVGIIGVFLVIALILGGRVWLDSRQQPLTIEASEELLDSLIHDGNFTEAITVAEVLLGENPDDVDINRRLAYLLSMTGDVEGALSYLDVAVDNGYDDYLWMSLSSGLENIRGHPRTGELIQEAYGNLVDATAGIWEEKTIRLREGEWTEIRLEHETEEYPSVDMALTYDADSFTIRAVVSDLHFRDGERSWRYGDGFLINFVILEDEGDVDSPFFYEMGFSVEHGVPVGVIVNLDGVAYLDNVMPPTITIDEESRTADYTITLPWSYLVPFRPLLDERAGINIRYTSAGDNGSRRLYWIPDPQYDSEAADRRRFAPLLFEPSTGSGLQVTGELGTRLLDRPVVEVTHAIYSPRGVETSIEVTVTDSGNEVVAESYSELVLDQGRTLLDYSLDIEDGEEGFYRVKSVLNGSLSWSETFYICGGDMVEALDGEVDALSEPGGDSLFVNSVESLRYRIDVLGDTLSSYRGRDNPRPIVSTFREISSLITECGEEGSVFTGGGYVLAAFESPVDGSLQPYSLMLPARFDPGEAYDLVFALHGSGVDELDTLRDAQSDYDARNCIVAAPRGRDLSGFWVGDTETDNVHLLGLLGEMFNIDKTLLAGFSMGGYGCWRLSLLYPELFDAVVVGSGIPYNPRVNIPEYDMRERTGAGKDLPFLVIHGTEDQSIDVGLADEFVERLQGEGYDVTYIRVEGGGHADISVSPAVFGWLSENFY